MSLFSNEKDLIHRIANLILIIWFVVAVFILYSSSVDLLVKEPVLTYNEYKIQNCNNFEPVDGRDEEEYCQDRYDQYEYSNKRSDFYNLKGIIDSIGNVIIVGTFLYFLNRKSK